MNRVAIAGFLGKEPDIRTFDAGQLANFSLGVKRKDVVDWFPCVAWNELANELQSAQKGQQLAIEGYLKAENWNDKQTGQKREKTVIVATKLIISPLVNRG